MQEAEHLTLAREDAAVMGTSSKPREWEMGISPTRTRRNDAPSPPSSCSLLGSPSIGCCP